MVKINYKYISCHEVLSLIHLTLKNNIGELKMLNLKNLRSNSENDNVWQIAEVVGKNLWRMDRFQP